jgi:hypothetical protein
MRTEKAAICKFDGETGLFLPMAKKAKHLPIQAIHNQGQFCLNCSHVPRGLPFPKVCRKLPQRGCP